MRDATIEVEGMSCPVNSLPYVSIFRSPEMDSSSFVIIAVPSSDGCVSHDYANFITRGGLAQCELDNIYSETLLRFSTIFIEQYQPLLYSDENKGATMLNLSIDL